RGVLAGPRDQGRVGCDRERRRVSAAYLDASGAASAPAPFDDRIDIAAVLGLTAEVEAAIEAGEWQHAADLEAQRRAVLVALVERQAAAASISPELRNAIADLASRTYRLIGLAQHH